MKKTLTRICLCASLLTLAGGGTSLLSSCNTTPAYARQYEEHREAQKGIDDASIMKYLTDNNITNYTRTTSGLYLVKQVEGTGESIAKGSRVQTQYIGRVLDSGVIGTRFDSSYDNATPCQCFQVVVGAGQVIAGWDEALELMKVGDHSLLLIPSGLGYGFNDGSGRAIPENIGADRVLAFEMVINRIVR